VEKLVPMLILASTSPTRKALMEKASFSFSVVPANIGERALEIEAPMVVIWPGFLPSQRLKRSRNSILTPM
jgi:hypothetical protein